MWIYVRVDIVGRGRNGRQNEVETDVKTRSKRDAKSSLKRTSVDPLIILEFSIFAAAAAAAAAGAPSRWSPAPQAPAAAAAAKIEKLSPSGIQFFK